MIEAGTDITTGQLPGRRGCRWRPVASGSCRGIRRSSWRRTRPSSRSVLWPGTRARPGSRSTSACACTWTPATSTPRTRTPSSRSGFDFINAFNAWKRSEQAGRRFVVDGAGDAGLEVTGLAWRGEVSAQVFEEAAVDLSKALRAWTDSRKGKRAGRKVGHPRFKKKTDRGSFRMRNKTAKGRVSIRVGEGHPRSVTLPGIGVVRVHDDTRRLRRMLTRGRARVLFATVSRRGGRWKISLNIEAAD